jgi:hypothetical protein
MSIPPNPTNSPTVAPTFGQPSAQPSRQPSTHPSSQPSEQPSSQPSSQPFINTSPQPSTQPSSQPSQQPTSRPSKPSSQPTTQPTLRPSYTPLNLVNIPLGVCKDFVALAGTAVSFDGVQTTLFTGNVGVAPGTSITGNYVVVSGSEELNSVKAIQGTADLIIAYNAAKGAICKPNNILQSSDLAGRTLLPGIHEYIHTFYMSTLLLPLLFNLYPTTLTP